MDIKYPIHTVQNAIQLLFLFTNERPEWSLTELAREKAFNINRTKRLIQTLVDYGYLEKNHVTKKYQLGLSILRLSGVITTTMDIYKEARSILIKLIENANLDFHIGVLEDTHVVYLDKFETLYTTRSTSFIGKRNPAYCTGCGKVLLAYKEKSLQLELIKKIQERGFRKFGPRTVSSKEELEKDLDIIVKNGYAISTDELTEGITSIGVPIYDYSENVIAAISLTGRTQHMSQPKIIEDLLKSSNRISAKLGYVKTV